jgi:DNA-binding CsgD family transcriptional regulator
MRAILVGPAAARARLRRELASLSIDVVGEFASMAEAQASPSTADAIVVAVDHPDTPRLMGSDPINGATQRGDGEYYEALTPRELEVLELLAEGLPNKRIADRLGISDQTVKFHIASILGKLGAANRLEAVRRAVRRGLLSL